jgi:hypothetical protein
MSPTPPVPDGELFPAADADTGRQGPTERAVRAALAAAALDDRDKAAGELAAQHARAVDVAQRVRVDPYGVAAAGQQLLNALVELRMTPKQRLGNDAGELTTWLQGIREPTTEP